MRYGCITPVILGLPNASKRGTESAVPRKGAIWLRNPCYLESPQHFRAGERINNARQVGVVAT